jgi:hypothetical protein
LTGYPAGSGRASRAGTTATASCTRARCSRRPAGRHRRYRLFEVTAGVRSVSGLSKQPTGTGLRQPESGDRGRHVRGGTATAAVGRRVVAERTGGPCPLQQGHLSKVDTGTAPPTRGAGRVV